MFLELFSVKYLESFKVASEGVQDLLRINLKILRDNPDDQNALFVVVGAFAHLRDWNNAIKHLERNLQIRGEEPHLLNDLSICYWNRGDYHQCHATLKRLLSFEPSWLTYDMLCVVCNKIGQKGEAVVYGEEAISRGGSPYSEPLSNLATAYLDVGRYEDAARLLKRALIIDGDNTMIKVELAQAYLGESEYNHAEPIIDELMVSNDRDQHTHLLAGMLWEGKQQYLNAIEEFKKAVQCDPGAHDAMLHLARLLYRSGMNREAVSHFIYIEALGVQLQAEDYFMMGSIYGLSNAHEKAVSAYKKSLLLTPKAETLHAMGKSLLELRNTDEALECFQDAVRMNPDHAEARMGIAKVHELHNDLLRALQEYECCIRIQPKLSVAHRSMANLYLRLGNTQKALDEVSLSLENAPNDPETYYLQGFGFAQMGDLENAIQSLENCLRLCVYHRHALDLLVKLREGQKGAI